MNENTKIIVTKEGLDKLKGELTELIDVRRPEVAIKIREARDMGDISENSAYETAMQEKSYIEGRIAELEEIIKNSVVSKDTNGNSSVAVGCKVVVHIEGAEQEYHIVGGPEANPMENKISHESPLGSKLMGKKVGDKINVEAPVGMLTYTIKSIK